MKTILLLSLALELSLICAFAEGIQDYLPKNQEVTAQVYTIANSETIELIMDKVQQALEKNPEWLLEYAQEHEELIGPLPYHENFGITEEEYAEILDTKSHLFLEEFSTIQMHFETLSDGHTQINGILPNGDELFEIFYNPNTDEMVCAHGILGGRGLFANNDPQVRGLRPWEGTMWDYANLEPEHFKDLRFSLGKCTDGSKLGCISYNMKYIEGETIANPDWLIYYPIEESAK